MYFMNKDVIYIESEDDITDIITKIENAKEKIFLKLFSVFIFCEFIPMKFSCYNFIV